VWRLSARQGSIEGERWAYQLIVSTLDDVLRQPGAPSESDRARAAADVRLRTPAVGKLEVGPAPVTAVAHARQQSDPRLTLAARLIQTAAAAWPLGWRAGLQMGVQVGADSVREMLPARDAWIVDDAVTPLNQLLAGSPTDPAIAVADDSRPEYTGTYGGRRARFYPIPWNGDNGYGRFWMSFDQDPGTGATAFVVPRTASIVFDEGQHVPDREFVDQHRSAVQLAAESCEPRVRAQLALPLGDQLPASAVRQAARAFEDLWARLDDLSRRSGNRLPGGDTVSVLTELVAERGYPEIGEDRPLSAGGASVLHSPRHYRSGGASSSQPTR
jgi:hypothetical protein